MKKTDKKDTINLFFSAFLITAFIVCAHFFSNFADTLSSTAGAIVSALIFVVFGLLVFYATRVGNGKAVIRFSPVTLIVMVLPALYIIIASVAAGLPLHDQFITDNGSMSVITILACVALGYGIPYTFVSGFELACDEETEEETEETAVLEGGIEADLADNSEEEASAEEFEASEKTEADEEEKSEEQSEE